MPDKAPSKSRPEHSATVVLPYPPYFPELLKDYCEQIGAAIRENRHHDSRRHLFLNFLHQAFNV